MAYIKNITTAAEDAYRMAVRPTSNITMNTPPPHLADHETEFWSLYYTLKVRKKNTGKNQLLL